MTKYNIAILGATGAVGESILDILAQRQFPVEQVYPLASHRSQGKDVRFGSKKLEVQDAAEFDFSKVHLAIFKKSQDVL